MGYWEDRKRFNRIHELRSELCGHCDQWMKCTCPREKRGGKPSCCEPGCSQFVRSAATERLIQELSNAQISGGTPSAEADGSAV